MSFRRRITLASSAAVAIAVVLASILVYVLTSDQLHSQVDTQLRERAHGATRFINLLEAAPATATRSDGRSGDAVAPLTKAQLRRLESGHTGANNFFGRLAPTPDQVRGYQQVFANGNVLVRSNPNFSLPVDPATRRLAARGGAPVFSDAYVKGIHLRVYAEPFGSDRALQLAQPLTETDSLLSRLRLILALLDVGGIALAALLGRLVAGAAVRPLRALSRTTEHVALTRDLSRRIEQTGSDEIGSLTASFNAMLDALQQSMAALDASVDAQRQLVADASHELRTPVTSLRTNIEILQMRGTDMSPTEQQQMLTETVEQLEELTLLMNDLIELARGENPRADTEDVRLDLLIEEVLERARRNSPGTPFDQQLAPTLLACVPARIERAVANLLDNAVKHSPAASPVRIDLIGRELTVRDHGAGIAAQDLPYVFDRFYRGAEARGRPGSGLGLAIVRQVADQLGGTISADPAPGGGTIMRLKLPAAEPLPERAPAALASSA
ncbi:MAG TPA: HAMP domain-containing sensor histidine kinase [Solirubrobacteraceae bacterium]|jgi:two-component system sensor histidine kinase MprB|nr:HAMP domain-containing sensor histidine kinase [Solirubrobacteraceae bacterium]